MQNLKKITVESTYKYDDLEEAIDVLILRPLAFSIAKFLFLKTRITPEFINFMKIVTGIFAAITIFPEDIFLNSLGVIWIITHVILDNVDGQLARMQKVASLQGKIIDGTADNLAFLALYLSLFARLYEAGLPILQLLLIISISIISHQIQSLMADRYREIYTHFVKRKSLKHFDTTNNIKQKISRIDISNQNWFACLLYKIYYVYTSEQEVLSFGFKNFYNRFIQFDSIPYEITLFYKGHTIPQKKYYTMLMTKLRLFILCLSVLTNKIIWFFIFEIILLNGILVYVMLRHYIIFNLTISQLSVTTKSTDE